MKLPIDKLINMKKFLLVLGMSFLLTNASYGQTQQDSINAYNKVKKWAVVKLTIAYMEDLKGWPPHSAENEFDKSDPLEVETYKKINNKYRNYSTQVDLDQVAELLLNGWKKTRDSIFKKYKEDIVDSIKPNLYHFQEIEFVPEKTSTIINREKVIVEINKKYNSLLSTQKKVIEKHSSSKITTQQISESNQIDIGSKNQSETGVYLVYILLTVSVLLNVYLIFRNRSKKKNRTPEKNKYQNYYESQNKVLERKNTALTQELDELKNIIKNYKILSKEDKVISQIKEVVEDQKAPTMEFEIPKTEQAVKKLIYFPSPFENNRFAAEDESEIVKPTSLYVAEIDEVSNKGIITLIENADLSRALNSPNIYLETVCEYENAYNPNAKGIKVIKDGEVVLENDDWIVLSKIKIKFI